MSPMFPFYSTEHSQNKMLLNHKNRGVKSIHMFKGIIHQKKNYLYKLYYLQTHRKTKIFQESLRKSFDIIIILKYIAGFYSYIFRSHCAPN